MEENRMIEMTPMIVHGSNEGTERGEGGREERGVLSRRAEYGGS